MGVWRPDKRSLYERDVVVGVNERFKKKLIIRWLKWAGHVERMGDENCPESGGKRGKGVREFDERTASKEILKEWVDNGEQQQKREGVGDLENVKKRRSKRPEP